MRRFLRGCLVLPLAAVILEAQAPRPADPRAVLNTYCVGCHNARLRTGNLVLDEVDPARVGAAPDLWERVVRKLRTREMPPAGGRRPDEETYRGVIASLETALDAAAEAAPRPGRVPVHRLNRAEYANAIRDLLALEVDARTLIADEPSGHGFENVASVLTASPALIESYLSAASTVSRLAVGDRSAGAVVDTFRIPTAMAQDDRAGDGQPFGSRGGTVVRYQFPVNGTYTIKVVLKRQLYLYLIGMGEPHQIDLRLDGALLKRFTIGGEGRGMTAPESFAGNTQGDPGWEVYMHTADAGLEVRVPVSAGAREVSVSFPRQHIEPEGVLQPPQRGFARTTNELYFGEPAVDSVLVGGPYQPSAARDTASRRKIFVCRPANRADEEPCARRILSAIARRAYRRPVTAAEVKTLLDFYRAGRADGDFDLGIERGLRRVLSAPAFLFRVERDSVDAAQGRSAFRVNDLDLASRLSFFLWSSIPDEELLDAAVRGTLSAPATLERQVKRMLKDDRSQALVDNFAMQWLQLGRLAGVVPDVDEFPGFDENLREAMQQETRLFVADQLRGDHSVIDLVSANYSFVNERLARHYKLRDVYGSRFRRVTFADGARGGLLGQAGILTATSYPNRTSPVLRGRWLLETLLGAPPPPPPPDVPPLKENGADGARTTVRARLDAHRKNPGCAICHVRMDPLGFSLENFDALGQWRTVSDGAPVDASASLPDGSRFDGVSGLRALLVSHREDFVRTFTDRLLSYAIGRGTEPADQPAVRRIVREAAAQDHRWSAIILGVVRSTPFGMTASAPPPAVAHDVDHRDQREQTR